jgi:hypothetical protein
MSLAFKALLSTQGLCFSLFCAPSILGSFVKSLTLDIGFGSRSLRVLMILSEEKGAPFLRVLSFFLNFRIQATA